MAKPFEGWTFGVEFELVVAYLTEYPKMPTPDPSETRLLHFNPTPEESSRVRAEMLKDDPEVLEYIDEVDEKGKRTTDALKYFNMHLYWEVISEHIKKTLEAAGHQIGDGGIDKWAITTDSSVRGPEGNEYEHAAFEIVSPAFHYCPGSIQAVEDFLAVLTSTYCALMSMKVPACMSMLGPGRQITTSGQYRNCR